MGRLVGYALVATLALFILQVIFSVLTGSLSLISDTAHLFGDTLALGLVFVVQKAVRRLEHLHETAKDHYHFSELLASAFNGLLLVAMGVGLAIEAVRRLSNPVEISGILWLYGLIGLAGNVVIFLILQKEGTHINLRGLRAHLISDSIASIGVVVAGVLITLTGEELIDTAIAFGIIFLVIRWGAVLTVESVGLLLSERKYNS